MSKDPCIELTEALLRCRSITPVDDGAQALIAERLERCGFVVHTVEVGGVRNLWAERLSNGPLFTFAGHTDVVPPGDVTAWSSDPFEPTLRDGKLYARGAEDMKSGVAAMVVALESFVAAHERSKLSLGLLLAGDEEGDPAHGTDDVLKWLSERGTKIAYCIVGEPTSEKTLGDTVKGGRRGSISMMVTVRGKQGHVAHPQRASNPILATLPVFQELCARRWDQGTEDFLPTSFQITNVNSGVGVANVIPAELTFICNWRFSTELTAEQIRGIAHETLDKHGLNYEHRWVHNADPFLTGPGVLRDVTLRAIESEVGKRPQISTGGGTSDARFVAKAGIDVLEVGLVNGTLHGIDEHVTADDIPRLSKLYLGILEELEASV